MKKLFVFTLIVLYSTITFSQRLSQQNKTFKKYEVFQASNSIIDAPLRAIATDVEALNVNATVLLNIQNDKPEFISFQIDHGSQTLVVKMQRQEILTQDYKLRNQNDVVLDYQPGLYYRGIINDDYKSLVVFNFFEDSVNGVISILGEGNRNIGQLEQSNQYVIYTDSAMTVTQDFQCLVDEIEQEEDLIPQNQALNRTPSSVNCVRVFYEITNDIYVANLESVSNTMNWLTSVHNIVAALYSDASIPTALSDVLIWQEEDPYTGDNLDKLDFFRTNRLAFDGDIGHLLDLPVTGGVAYLNSLCQSFRYAFSGVSMNFQQLPTYSWTVNVVAHEMGHSLGSPHTHACFWNGDNTAIDVCGPNFDIELSEGCVDGPIPVDGGTIMSYCHLDAVGVNFANGFHPQVGAYMSSNVDTKACLGSDCITSCVQTIAGLSVSQTDQNSFTVTIDDVIANSWDYRIFELDGFPSSFTTTNTNSFNYNTIAPNTYYLVQILSNCANGSTGSFFNFLYLSDDDWCSGKTFTDDGGLDGNYRNNVTFEKTFYPDTDSKVTFTINDFNLEEDFDFMTIYDGDSSEERIFAGGRDLTGSALTTTFFEATNDLGAITVKFTSDSGVNESGWDITVACSTLSNEGFTERDFSVFPNPVNNELNITSSIPLDHLIIYDISGRMVFQKVLGEQLNTSIDLNQLNSGVYLMKVIKGESSVIRRIIKN